MQDLEESKLLLSSNLKDQLSSLPNIPHDDVPEGLDENSNIQIKEFGNKTKPSPNHFEIGEEIGMLDFESAVKLSGSRFSILKKDLALMERSLANFMIDQHVNINGYDEVSVPYLVKDDAMFGTGQLPKFSDDQFKTEDGFWLIPTAEVPLTNLHRNTLVDQNKLPLKLTSHTPCFRSEAGSYGRDTKGLIRQHQFEKIELVQIAEPKNSMIALDGLLGNAEEILQLLELPYQVVELCTGDIGFSACKTFDIEVWMPSQNKYREISSCSNFGDFQARRANIKIKSDSGKGFAHTLNGSALAVGRTLIAILENFIIIFRWSFFVLILLEQ